MGDGHNTERGILIHAASMGEVNSIRSLITELVKHIPAEKIVITTTTVAGLKAASAIHPEVKTRLSVLDIPSLRKKQLESINPALVCIVETEIWPNLLWQARRKGVAVMFLNARLGSRSIRRLKSFKPLLNYVGGSIKEILAKSEVDAARFKQLFKAPVSVAGNLKFSLRPQSYRPKEIRQEWGFGGEELIVCFGSTRPGEEALILPVYDRLLMNYPELRLVLAPRHPQRLDEVKKICAGYNYWLYSELDEVSGRDGILIIDQLGVLNQAYSICDIALVGGSFFDFGGHNPLEPAFYGKPVVMGIFHSSCQESVDALLSGEGIIVCAADELSDKLGELLSSGGLRNKLGSNARKVIDDFQDSFDKHLAAILKWYQ